MARSEPIADDSLPDMRARSRPGNRDRRDDADDRHDDQQLDERETLLVTNFHDCLSSEKFVGRLDWCCRSAHGAAQRPT